MHILMALSLYQVRNSNSTIHCIVETWGFEKQNFPYQKKSYVFTLFRDWDVLLLFLSHLFIYWSSGMKATSVDVGLDISSLFLSVLFFRV